MRAWETVAIVGVGLIGASIGLALRRRGLAGRIVGIGRNASRLETARAMGAVTTVTTDLDAGVAEADLIVVCTPVAMITSHVRAVAAACPDHALITDAGSTKGFICRQLAAHADTASRFVGSHPMAGSEKSGARFAQEDLFEQRVTIVTPVGGGSDAVPQIEAFWDSLGSRVVRMSPDAHDAAVAAISHMPHLIASALAAATATEDLRLAAGGWSDTTRVASGDAELWRQILIQNQGHVLQSVDKFAKVLADFREALATEDAARLEQLLDAGKQKRDALGS
jgi:prephenate dehydrogenase